MEDNTQTPQPRATFRQWDTVTYDCMDGAVIQVRRHTVALYRSKFGNGVMGIVDGKAVSLREAVSILEGASVTTKTAEVLEAPTPTIGKPAACELHKELGRLQFRDHYTTASEALGRTVYSLAALTASEAQQVRSYAYGQWGMTA